ncbi:MAG TPA: hypothetical protein V6C90_05555 [Coleofasciculaceae cyanobacterium]
MVSHRIAHTLVYKIVWVLLQGKFCLPNEHGESRAATQAGLAPSGTRNQVITSGISYE